MIKWFMWQFFPLPFLWLLDSYQYRSCKRAFDFKRNCGPASGVCCISGNSHGTGASVFVLPIWRLNSPGCECRDHGCAGCPFLLFFFTFAGKIFQADICSWFHGRSFFRGTFLFSSGNCAMVYQRGIFKNLYCHNFCPYSGNVDRGYYNRVLCFFPFKSIS